MATFTLPDALAHLNKDGNANLRLVASLTKAERAERADASHRHRPTCQQRAELAEIARQWRERAQRRWGTNDG